MKFLILSILFYLFHLNAYSQQNASLMLSTDSGYDFILVDEESKIYEGDIKQDTVRLIESNAGQDVELAIVIEDVVHMDDAYKIQLSAPSGSNYFGYSIENGEISIEDSYGSMLLTSTPFSNFSIVIVRCLNTIFYVHENTVLFCRELEDNDFDLHGLVHVEEAVDAGVDIDMHPPLDCEYLCGQIKEHYLVLDDFIDWRSHVVIGDSIKFKYVEKYSVPMDNNIICQLFDNENGPVDGGSGELPNTYGINFQEWDISGTDLVDGNYYVLRVSGMNKGKNYNIRFRYESL